jgi:hypothetical protein
MGAASSNEGLAQSNLAKEFSCFGNSLLFDDAFIHGLAAGAREMGNRYAGHVVMEFSSKGVLDLNGSIGQRIDGGVSGTLRRPSNRDVLGRRDGVDRTVGKPSVYLARSKLKRIGSTEPGVRARSYFLRATFRRADFVVPFRLAAFLSSVSTNDVPSLLRRICARSMSCRVARQPSGLPGGLVKR